MPDLPKLDRPDEAAPRPEGTQPATGSSPPESALPDSTAGPGRTPSRLPSPGTLAGAAALVGLVAYGAAGFLRETGLYDVGGWSKPAAPPTLSGLSGPRPAPPSGSSPTPFPAAPVGASGGSLRDQPPRLPTTDLPQFTVRDGEPRDYMIDLDAETLKRLAEIQGQLDGLGAQVTALHQAVQALANNAGQQRQQEAVHQGRLQQDMTAARAEIAGLQTALGEVEARLKRARAGQGLAALEPAAPSGGRALPGWSVTAISGDRAWLRSPKGQAVTVVAGDRLKGVGAVRAVDAARGVVTVGDGRVVR